MKILHVVATYLPATRYGGTIVSVHGLCRSLAARGHDVEVFTTSVDGDGDSAVEHDVPVRIDGVTVRYFPSRQLRRLYYSPDLGRALRDRIHTFDVVHTHAIYLWPLWVAAHQARAHGIPYLISPRGMLEKDLIERKSPLWKSLLIAFKERRNLERAAAIHVTSAREAEEAHTFGFSLPPLIEIPNGVDIEASGGGEPSEAIRGLMAAGPYALFLGRINWKKGLDRLLNALSLADGVRLIVAGNDEEGHGVRLRAQAQALGIIDRVHFVGPVWGADKSALLRAARLLVLPSYSENFGNVIVEAWAAGCPALVTPEVGLADRIRQDGGGWVAAGDPVTLGGQLAAVWNDPAQCVEQGAVGRRLAEHQFSWSSVAERMERAYQSVVRG